MTELSPATGLGAHSGAEKDVIVLEDLRSNISPPIKEGGLPLLEGSLEAAIAR